MKALIVILIFCSALAYASNITICTNGYQLVNNKCWKLYKDSANHTTAERKCNEDGGTLFMTKNAIDNRAVGSFVGTAARIDRIWMGVFCMNSEKSQCYWDDQTGTTASFDFFANGYPNSGSGRCVYYSMSGSPSGQWFSGDCSNKLPYVCELPSTHSDSCDLNFNDNCYFRQDAQSFSAAQRQCEQLCGDVVSIHSAEENRFVASAFSQYNYDYVYIGGIATSNDFVVWNDGSTMDYLNLETYNSGSCLTMSMNGNTRGTWFASDCTTSRPFLCKRPVGASNCRGTPAPPPPPPPTPSCSSGVHMAPGFIATPGFPSTYDSGCQYTLTTFGSNRIHLYFYTFSLQFNDYAYIYDGDSSHAQLLAKLNGACIGCSYISTGNTMYIDFVYDSLSTSFKGFNASFYSIF